ncbi:SMP-30/gluconolactonase/LRE family protein [candidate division KSB1 bacterium]|nr:SMP-30/gluconolactonase/LRE family protein [candidate division KSB1 bacterium]
MPSRQPEFELLIRDLNFPEGPAWDRHETLYVSNCYGNWITRFRAHQSDTFLIAADSPFTFSKTNGMTVARDGNIYACDFGCGAILKIQPNGQSEIYANGYQGQRFQRPNDLAFDPNGNLYFTDPNHYRRENPDGVIYRITTGTREVNPVATQLAFPNGIAFSADARSLFVCESAFNRVLKFTVLTNGMLSPPEVFVELPGGDPDGINFDQAGNLYVAHFGGGAVYVIAPDGSIRQKLNTPGKRPTNVEFGGPNLQTLFVTEAETNALYQLQVTIPGLPLNAPPQP